MVKNNGLNEAWMLYVALKQGRLGTYSNAALKLIGQFLQGGTWEDPAGALSNSQIKAADIILQASASNQHSAPEKHNQTVDLTPIIKRFAATKSKVLLNELELSAAPSGGANPGAVYVRVKGCYAGKITPAGDFKPATLEWDVAWLPARLKQYADNLTNTVTTIAVPASIPTGPAGGIDTPSVEEQIKEALLAVMLKKGLKSW